MTPPTARYVIGESLEKGGMGEVFLADDTQLGRKVAIKFLTESLEADETARERLHREARSAAALDHPFVCKIYELADIDGRTGIVMEYVTGETLQTRLRRAPLSPKEALEIASEVAEALDEAHQHRVVHRDLKPSNVMLTTQGHVKVMDFGLAKTVRVGTPSDEQSTGSLTDPGVRVGTPGYMAPEQLLGGHVDERSDIFAFGILLYELLAGLHPFTRASPSGTMAAILKETPAPISQYSKDAPESARVTLDRLLAKEPHQRYQSFGELRTDLGQLLRDASGMTPAPRTAPIGATSTVERTPFVGRDTERAEARRLLDQAVAGQGSLLLLGGEPGVGKTRLAEEVLAEARQRGCLALTGRCYEMEGTPPFIPWVEVVEHWARITPSAAFREVLGDAASEVAKLVPELRRTFPEIPQPIELPPAQQRRYLFNSFLEFVERGARITPHALLIDDLHWADESTLLLLQHFAQQLERIPLLIIGTYRDVDLDIQRPFAEMLEALTRQRLAHKLALGRLDERGVAEMLKVLSNLDPPPALVTAVYTETEGNPFFTEEVFHHLAEEGRILDEQGEWRTDLRVESLEVPEGVRLVIGRRLKRLSDEARRVLAGAAIVGRSFDVGLLEALGDAEGEALETALEEAESAKVILTTSSGRELRWEFAHGLIRQTLEHSVSLMRRQRTHLRVAEAMERVYGKNAERFASDIGQHLYQAGVAADPEKTVRYLTLAGDQALAKGAFDEALRQLSDALSIQEEHDRDDQRIVADLHDKKAQALRGGGHWEEAVAEWFTALSGFYVLRDYAATARTAYLAWYTLAWNGRGEEGRPEVERALAAVDVAGPERCRLLMLAGLSLSYGGKSYGGKRGGADLIAQAVSMAEDLGDDLLYADVMRDKAWHHHHLLQTREGLETARRAEDYYRSTDSLNDLAEVQGCAQIMEVYRAEFGKMARDAPALLKLADRVGHVYAGCLTRLWQVGNSAVTTGDLEQAVTSLREEVDRQRRIGFGLLPFALLTMATVLAWRGEWPEAERYYREAATDEPQFMWTHMFTSPFLLARVQFGDTDAAAEIMSIEVAARAGVDNLVGEWEQLLNVVEGRAILGERAAAAALYPLVEEGLGTGAVMSRHSRLWQMVAGIAAACGQHWDAAQEHFETALRQAHELPHVIAQPETRRWYAQMLLDRNAPGDRDKSRTLVGEAIDQYRTIGMPKHLAMAEGMLKGV